MRTFSEGVSKRLVWLLCGTVVLSGCTGNPSPGGETAADQKKVSAPGTFPIVDEKITIKLFTKHDPKVEDYATNEFTKWYEEKTNIHIDWQTVPVSALAEKLQVTLAGGDLPEVIMTAGLTPSQLVAYGSQGLFLPLNDLIDQYAPNIKKMMEQVPESRKYLYAPDGNIYGLPRYSENVHTSMPKKLWINQKWLDNLGLQMPETTEDLYNVLKAFKTKDPNGNGKADEIPFAGATQDNNEPESFIMQSFLFFDRDTYVMVENDKIVFTGDSEGYKEGLKYLRRLIQEGLLAPESFTQDRKALTALSEAPEGARLGAAPGLIWTQFSVSNSPLGRDKEFVPVPILAGPDGKRYGFDKGESVIPAEFVITKNAKNPEAAIRWINFFYDSSQMLETGMSPSYGIEGVHWEKIEPGKFGLDGVTPAEFRILVQPGTPGNYYWNQSVPSYSTVKTMYRYEVTPEMDSEVVLYNTTKELYKPYSMLDKKLPFLYFMPEDLAKYGDLQKNIVGVVRQFMLKFVTGNLDIDKDWDKYIQELNNAGLKQYVDILQETYDKNKE